MKSLAITLALAATFVQADEHHLIGDKDFSRGSLENIHRNTNEIVLTFDDGPTPGVTEKVLDVLKEYNVKAAFFVVGKNVVAYPKIMKRIVDEGHIIANHSMSHTALRDLPFYKWRKVVKAEVLDAHAVMEPYFVNSNHFYFRAPEGAWDEKYAGYLNQDVLGKDYIGPVLWDIGGEVEVVNGQYVQAADWACWSRKISVDDCLSGYLYESRKYKGGVVLMHDLRQQSAQMLAKYIPAIIASGFKFSTLDDVNWK